MPVQSGLVAYLDLTVTDQDTALAMRTGDVPVLATPRVVQAGYGWIVFGATVLIFVLAFLGLAYSIYPYIVIDRLTVWQAASATESLVVIGIGVAITLPAIIAYTIFMYRVFWGKARELTYGL